MVSGFRKIVFVDDGEMNLALKCIIDGYKESRRPLEEYLRSVIEELKAHEYESGITIQDFIALLKKSGLVPIPEYDDSWNSIQVDYEKTKTYQDTVSLLKYQVVDLKQMEAVGTFDNEYRYMGVSSPRGSRWYNFDISTFLRCGAEGSFGYDPVPGKTPPKFAVVASDETTKISWGLIWSFFYCGQIYE